MAPGLSHTIVLSDHGEMFCTGSNTKGQLGLELSIVSSDTFTPGFTLPGKRWKSVACGQEHTLAVTDDGKLYVFGANEHGQLSLKKKIQNARPTFAKFFKDEKVLNVHCGYNHSFVRTENRLYLFGDNSSGAMLSFLSPRRF